MGCLVACGGGDFPFEDYQSMRARMGELVQHDSLQAAAELLERNQPGAESTEKSLDLLCSLCEFSREELEQILDALNRAGEKKYGVLF
jgi:hypothetical protein